MMMPVYDFQSPLPVRILLYLRRSLHALFWFFQKLKCGAIHQKYIIIGDFYDPDYTSIRTISLL